MFYFTSDSKGYTDEHNTVGSFSCSYIFFDFMSTWNEMSRALCVCFTAKMGNLQSGFLENLQTSCPDFLWDCPHVGRGSPGSFAAIVLQDICCMMEKMLSVVIFHSSYLS